MEPKGSLPCLQETANWPYPEAAKFSLYPQNSFKIIYVSVSQPAATERWLGGTWDLQNN
jgi:hypothetical protein